jgi:site-specific recombinase XerD
MDFPPWPLNPKAQTRSPAPSFPVSLIRDVVLRSSTLKVITGLSTSHKGGRRFRTPFLRVFQAVAEAAGLPSERRHSHVLKHSLASHLVAGNVNLALVKRALGYRSISSIRI